ncbi:uncharacterized protein LOC134719342 [Mytilus trossulus]|uniref:uncharacterized protein LOC134719342 n=1 Tax=Mytilus trossulus TaxID=6551 RepID=UPI00300536D4
MSAVNNEGNSPLHMAVIFEKDSSVTTLITLGADPSARNKEGNSHTSIRSREQSRAITKNQAPTKEKLELPTTMQSEMSKGPYMYSNDVELGVNLPRKKSIAITKAKENKSIKRLIHSVELTYQLTGDKSLYKVYAGGPCRAGKSTLASVLIGEKIPFQWNSTDGLVIYFGRNGIDIDQKKMVPLKEGDRGHNVLAKIIRGKPDVFNETKPRELDKRKTLVRRTTSKNQNENNTSKSLIKDMPMHYSVTRTSTNEFANQKHTPIAKSDLQAEGKEAPGKIMSKVRNDILTLECQRLKLQSDILDKVRTGQYKIEIAPSDLIDFGGQKSYDMTHQLFIQHKGSFLLMFDGRFGLHNQLEDYPEGVTAASILKHWVDSILTYTADADDIMPMILFAATHRDMCEGDTTKMKECFLADIKEMFSSHEKKNHIHLDTLYFINGVDKNDVDIQRMTDQIVIFAMRQTSWGQRRPMQWVPLELQISNMKLKNINILTKANLQQVNVLNADLALDEHQMDDFLLVQHSLGKLMYYNLPGLDKFIIIHPPALVNILRSFVTDEKFWPADTNLRYILETMTKTGRIYKRDLLKIWKQPKFNQYMQEDGIKEFVLKLLVHLDILIVPKAFKQSSTDVYLVPCMIKATRPDFNNLGSQREKTICLQYILAHSSIPSALAYKVIGAAVIAWPLKEEKDRPCLYHKAAVLNVSEDDELRIWVDDNRVNVYLTNKKSLLSISPDIAASIQDCLTKNIESSLLFYHSSFGRTLNPTRVSELYYTEIGIPCGGGNCFISSLEVTKTNKWICKNGKEHNTNYVRYWIFDKSQKTCSVGCAGLTDIELQTQPSDKHLVRLGSQIEYGIFREFFLNLGMELQKWRSTESTYASHSTEGIRSMALRQWKTCNLSKLKDPTLKHISDALKEVNFDSHLVCQIFRENMDLVEHAELNLQADPTDQHLKELSNQIGNCPLQLGIELGLSFTEVEHSLFRFPKDLPGLVEDILLKWKAKSKVKTILSLMMALQRVDAGGVGYLREIAKP